MSIVNDGVMSGDVMHGGVMKSQLPNGFILNPQPLTKWLTDRAAVKAGTGRARVIFAGDSSPASYGSDPIASYFGVKAVDARLARQFTADGTPATYTALFGGHGVAALSNWDYRASQGAWAYESGYGISAGGEFLLGTGTATLSFAPKDDTNTAIPTNACDIYYCQDPSSGGINKNVDGGANTPISQNGTSRLMKTSLTASLAAHTYNLLWQSGTANWIGFHCYNSAVPAIDFWNMASVGSYVTQWIDTTYAWNPGNIWSFFAPSLVIFSAGANDWLGGTSLSTIKANLKTALAQIKASGASVILMGYNPVDPTYSAVTTIAGQQALRDMLYQAAVESGVTFFDVLNEMGGAGAYPANNAALKMYDRLHRDFLGYTPAFSDLYHLISR